MLPMLPVNINIAFCDSKRWIYFNLSAGLKTPRTPLFTSYQFNISFEDKNMGLFLIAGAEYFISRRFSLLGRAQFNSIPTKKGSKLDENVNLGGTEFSLGLSFYF